MKVVTGATGHVGNVLVKQLLLKGEKVRAIVLPGENTAIFDNLDVEKFKGDVRDLQALKEGFKGADGVFHMASFISIIPGKEKLLYDINVGGTKNVIEACLFNNVRRLIYTSSIHAFQEPPHGQVINEDVPFSPEKALGTYGKTKAMASLEVLKASKNGLDAVIVCPTGIIGPDDVKLSLIGSMIVSYLRNQFRFYISGEYDFVDVRDIANGLILAYEKGRKGESYILSGEQITVRNLFKFLEVHTGIKAPDYKLPFWMGEIAAFCTEMVSRMTGREDPLNRESLSILRSNSLVKCCKAETELGYTHRPISDTVRDSVIWLKQSSFLKKRNLARSV